MNLVFVWWVAVAAVELATRNEKETMRSAPTIDRSDFVTPSDSVADVAENWQLLAVGSMVAFSIYLRQRGSAESKPVGTPHHRSAVEAE